MFQLIVYVPESHLEVVKSAIFAAGAGKYGNYDRCSWQVIGEGQFRPLAGANPFLGSVGSVETVPEWRLETIVDAAFRNAVEQALRDAHPYEEPAYHFFSVINNQ